MVFSVLRHELGYSDEQRSSWRMGQRDQVQVCIRQCTILSIPSTIPRSMMLPGISYTALTVGDLEVV